MSNKILVLIFTFLLLSIIAHSQDNVNGLSSGPAPNVNVQYPQYLLKTDAPNNYNSRAFAYNITGSAVVPGPFKFWLNGTGLTSLVFDNLNYVAASSFGCDGFLYGIRNLTNALIKIDTSTGITTNIAIVTGITTPTGLALDYTTGKMYVSNGTSGNNKIGTINLSTGVVILLPGIVFETGILIDIACSTTGQLYGHIIQGTAAQSQIYSINKTTGVGTALPQTTGFIANNAQGMSWDRSVDTGYLAAYNFTTNSGELRRINIATGATTLIAALNCEADGMAIPTVPRPLIYPTYLNPSPPFTVNATIYPFCAGINPSKTKIFWTKTTIFSDSITFSNSGGFNWTTNMNIKSPGTYKYYLIAVDSINAFATAPAGAPANYYSFVTGPDTIKPVISHTPLTDCFKINWPAIVRCQATDNFSVDSVWVNWKKSQGNWNKFYLTHGTGNNWANPFNSDTTQVNYGDSIYYRIVAKDYAGLKDSTSLIGFKIINQAIVCNGNGTTSSNYPFSTYWEDGRTEMLYTASELLAAGGTPGNIVSLSFDVVSVGGPTMNGFNVKMQNTTATSITGFTNSFWTTCFNDSYTVSGTGWQTISLTTPFPWNGVNNLLIEICFNNAAWTDFSPVNSSSATNMMVGYFTDLPSGDGCTAAWTATVLPYRCNICMVIEGLSGTGKNTNVIPRKYSLFQNYPNPFNPVTQIRYAIPKNGFVTLNVFDILGREIAKLVNEEQHSGNYIVDFSGSNLASGVYFYRLEVNDFVDVKRMVIIK